MLGAVLGDACRVCSASMPGNAASNSVKFQLPPFFPEYSIVCARAYGITTFSGEFLFRSYNFDLSYKECIMED
uniref:Uncharacterized protein n=1 Tax=Romanomermis culicivorax TaxID=13658 RepID=A0A915LB52_ROMCU